MKRTFLIVVGFAASVLSAKDKEPAWEKALVVSQEITSAQTGTYAAPIGTGAVAVPIYRSQNRIVIEAGGYRYALIEEGRSQVILPVNGITGFYREGGKFVFWDVKKKKHRFVMMGMTAIPAKQP